MEKMSGNHTFEQIWGFRRNTDSSSDDSKSNSDIGKDQNKVMLVPNLSETNDRHVQVEKKPKRTRKVPKKENKNTKKGVKSKPKKDSCVSSNIKKVGNNSRNKKSKFISQMTVSDDFRIFTESILDDLRDARETMFAKMRKEMDQLVNSRSTKKRKIASNLTKKPNQKPRARKPTNLKQKNELAASKDQDHPQEQVKNENTNGPSSKNQILIDSSAKTPILIDSFVKNPILIDSSAKKPIFTNTPEHLATSCLTIPFGLSNTRPNDTILKLERGNNSGFDFRHNDTESSCVGNGYAVGLNHHQRFDISNNFGIPNRVFQGFPHDDSLLGTRVLNEGGIRYTSGFLDPTLPSHLGSNGFCNVYPN